MWILIFLAAAAFFSCDSDAVWSQNREQEHLYAAVTQNALLPPDGVSVTLDGVSPRLRWDKRSVAVGYRIYRALGGDGEWTAVTTSTVTETTFLDSEISLLTHSGVWRYAVASVNDAGKEGFRSAEALITIYAPDFNETVRMISASAGGYASEEGDGVPRKAVRIVFEPLTQAVAYAVFRKEPGKGSLLLTESATVDEIQTATKSAVCFYDETAQEGILYRYRIVPIDSLGRYGRESEEAEGFVFPTPQADAWDVSAEQATVRVSLPVEFQSKVRAFEVRFRDEAEATATARIWELSNGFIENLVLSESEIRALLGGKESRWFQIALRVQFEDGERERLGSFFTKEQSVLFFSRESSSLPVPSSVAVSHGKRQFDGTVDSPVVLKWKKPSDSRIGGYRIYRTEKLLFENGNDRSSWGAAVGEIEAAAFSDLITWSDDSFPRFGDFYYKINPYADKNTETENNCSLASFACAAVFPSELLPLSATHREFTRKIRLRWQDVPGIEVFNIHSYRKQIGTDKHITFVKTELETAANRFYDFETTTPGAVTFKINPVVVFSDGTRKLDSVIGDFSASAIGAIDLETVDWVRYVMVAVAEGQRTIVPGVRTRNEQKSVDRVSFYRRMGFWDRTVGYDMFGFNKLTDQNDSIQISGTLAHIYYQKSNEMLYFSYSINLGMPMSQTQLKDIDKTIKKSGVLTISGIYPGKLCVWGRNQGSDQIDRRDGLLPGMEFPNPSALSCASTFCNGYGFDLTYPTEVNFRGETTYAALRDEAIVYEAVSFSQVGSINY